jgi:hypothetical protein
VDDLDAAGGDLGAQCRVEVGPADRGGDRAVRFGSAEREQRELPAGAVGQAQPGRRVAGLEHLARIQVQGAQGGETVDGDGQPEAAFVGVRVVGLMDDRGVAGLLQGDGGDGAGDPAACDDGVFRHKMTMHGMTKPGNPEMPPRVGA